MKKLFLNVKLHDDLKKKRCPRLLEGEPCFSNCIYRHTLPKEDEIVCKYYYFHMKCDEHSCIYLHNERCSEEIKEMYNDKWASERCRNIMKGFNCTVSYCKKIHRTPKDDGIYCLSQINSACVNGSKCRYLHREDINISAKKGTSNKYVGKNELSDNETNNRVKINVNKKIDQEILDDIDPSDTSSSDDDDIDYKSNCDSNVSQSLLSFGVGNLLGMLNGRKDEQKNINTNNSIYPTKKKFNKYDKRSRNADKKLSNLNIQYKLKNNEDTVSVKDRRHDLIDSKDTNIYEAHHRKRPCISSTSLKMLRNIFQDNLKRDKISEEKRKLRTEKAYDYEKNDVIRSTSKERTIPDCNKNIYLCDNKLDQESGREREYASRESESDCEYHFDDDCKRPFKIDGIGGLKELLINIQEKQNKQSLSISTIEDGTKSNEKTSAYENIYASYRKDNTYSNELLLRKSKPNDETDDLRDNVISSRDTAISPSTNLFGIGDNDIIPSNYHRYQDEGRLYNKKYKHFTREPLTSDVKNSQLYLKSRKKRNSGSCELIEKNVDIICISDSDSEKDFDCSASLEKFKTGDVKREQELRKNKYSNSKEFKLDKDLNLRNRDNFNELLENIDTDCSVKEHEERRLNIDGIGGLQELLSKSQEKNGEHESSEDSKIGELHDRNLNENLDNDISSKIVKISDEGHAIPLNVRNLDNVTVSSSLNKRNKFDITTTTTSPTCKELSQENNNDCSKLMQVSSENAKEYVNDEIREKKALIDSCVSIEKYEIITLSDSDSDHEYSYDLNLVKSEKLSEYEGEKFQEIKKEQVFSESTKIVDAIKLSDDELPNRHIPNVDRSRSFVDPQISAKIRQDDNLRNSKNLILTTSQNICSTRNDCAISISECRKKSNKVIEYESSLKVKEELIENIIISDCSIDANEDVDGFQELFGKSPGKKINAVVSECFLNLNDNKNELSVSLDKKKSVSTTSLHRFKFEDLPQNIKNSLKVNNISSLQSDTNDTKDIINRKEFTLRFTSLEVVCTNMKQEPIEDIDIICSNTNTSKKKSACIKMESNDIISQCERSEQIAPHRSIDTINVKQEDIICIDDDDDVTFIKSVDDPTLSSPDNTYNMFNEGIPCDIIEKELVDNCHNKQSNSSVKIAKNELHGSFSLSETVVSKNQFSQKNDSVKDVKENVSSSIEELISNDQISSNDANYKQMSSKASSDSNLQQVNSDQPRSSSYLSPNLISSNIKVDNNHQNPKRKIIRKYCRESLSESEVIENTEEGVERNFPNNSSVSVTNISSKDRSNDVGCKNSKLLENSDKYCVEKSRERDRHLSKSLSSKLSKKTISKENSCSKKRRHSWHKMAMKLKKCFVKLEKIDIANDTVHIIKKHSSNTSASKLKINTDKSIVKNSNSNINDPRIDVKRSFINTKTNLSIKNKSRLKNKRNSESSISETNHTREDEDTDYLPDPQPANSENFEEIKIKSSSKKKVRNIDTKLKSSNNSHECSSIQKENASKLHPHDLTIKYQLSENARTSCKIPSSEQNENLGTQPEKNKISVSKFQKSSKIKNRVKSKLHDANCNGSKSKNLTFKFDAGLSLSDNKNEEKNTKINLKPKTCDVPNNNKFYHKILLDSESKLVKQVQNASKQKSILDISQDVNNKQMSGKSESIKKSNTISQKSKYPFGSNENTHKSFAGKLDATKHHSKRKLNKLDEKLSKKLKSFDCVSKKTKYASSSPSTNDSHTRKRSSAKKCRPNEDVDNNLSKLVVISCSSDIGDMKEKYQVISTQPCPKQ